MSNSSGNVVELHTPHDLSLPEGIDLETQLWRILVRPLEAKKQSAGGIHLPDEVQQAQEWNTLIGQVLQVGPEAYDSTTKGGIHLKYCKRVKPGDFVVYGAYAGQEIHVRAGKDVKRFRFLTADMILAITTTPDAFVRYV